MKVGTVKWKMLLCLLTASLPVIADPNPPGAAPCVARPWVTVSTRADNALWPGHEIVVAAREGRIVYCDQDEGSLGELRADFRTQIIIPHLDREKVRAHLLRQAKSLRSGTHGDTAFTEPVIAALAMAHRNGRVCLCTGLRGFGDGATYCLVQVFDGGKLARSWYMRIGRYLNRPSEPFDVTPSEEAVLLAPDSMTGLVVLNLRDKSLKRLDFQTPPSSPAAGEAKSAPAAQPVANPAEPPPRQNQATTPADSRQAAPDGSDTLPLPQIPSTPVRWSLDEIAAVACLQDGSVLVIERERRRACLIKLDGTVLATFEKGPDNPDGRRYLGAGKDFIIAYDEKMECGVFLGTDKKLIGAFPAPLVGEHSDAYESAAVVDDDRMFLVHGDGLRFYLIDRTKMKR